MTHPIIKTNSYCPLISTYVLQTEFYYAESAHFMLQSKDEE